MFSCRFPSRCAAVCPPQNTSVRRPVLSAMHGEDPQELARAAFFSPAPFSDDTKSERQPLVHVDVHHYGASAPNGLASPNGLGSRHYGSANGRPFEPYRKATDAPAGTETNWWGVFLAFLSGAFFTLSSAAVKALRAMDPMELLFVRAVLQVVVMLGSALCNGAPLMGGKGYRLLLQLQGLVGGLTLVLLFYSFRRLPLGDATTIIFSSPVVVMVLSFIFLKEPCGFFRTLIVCMLVTGVVLIAKPPFIFHGDVEQYDVVGYSCAVLATLFTALNMVVMRKCKDVHFSVVVLHLSLWTLALSLGLLLALGHHGSLWALFRHTPFDWAMAVVVSVLGLSGQVLVACALGHEGAGKVAVTRSLDMVLAFVLQVVAFGEMPDWISILGASLVLLCVLGMGLESQVLRLASLVP